MKKLKLQKGKKYEIKFDYDDQSKFHGIGEIKSIYADNYIVTILGTFHSSRERWKPEFIFVIAENAFIKEINKEENPEYFL